AGIGGVFEPGERLSALFRDLVRGSNRVVGDGEEVDVREVDPLLAAVVDPLPGEVAVQVHLPKANRVRRVVTFPDRGNRVNGGDIGNLGEGTDSNLNSAPQVSPIHRLGNVQRCEVARDVPADVIVGEIVVVGGGG